MLNMIKYQFYRSSRSISTYIALACLIIFSIMLVSMNATTPGAQEGENALSDYMSMTDFATFNFMSMAFTMVYGAWIAVYAYGEFQKGYIRNIASSVKNKCSFFLSHMAVCAVMYIICAVVSSASIMICAKLMITNIKLGDILFLAKFLLIQLYFHLALAAFILFVVYLARNAFIPVIVAFIFPMNLEVIPLMTIQNFIENNLGEKAEEINSWLDHTAITINIIWLEADMHNGDSLHKYFIMGGVMLVLYSVIACLSITKKDIK